MALDDALEAQVSSLTVEKVNAVIKKYFKALDQWTVVNGGDFQQIAICEYNYLNNDKLA